MAKEKPKAKGTDAKEVSKRELKKQARKAGDSNALYQIGGAAVAVMFALYAIAMRTVVKTKDKSALEVKKTVLEPKVAGLLGNGTETWGRSDDDSSLWMALLPVLIPVMIGIVVLVLFCFRKQKVKLSKEEQVQAAAAGVKNSLARQKSQAERMKLLEASREEFRNRACQQRAAREAAEQELLEEAKKMARMLRARREARDKMSRSKDDFGAGGETDSNGWTEAQRNRLTVAIQDYPSNWSHCQNDRWNKIAEEVGGGKKGRDCEMEHRRILARDEHKRYEKRLEKAQANKVEPSVRQQVYDIDDDLDWMGEMDGEDVLPFAEPELLSSDEDEEEEEEELRPERMAVELDPDHAGTEIRLQNITHFENIATLQVELLHVQVACSNCKAPADLWLSGADAELSRGQLWCTGCSMHLSAQLRPTLCHEFSSRLCYVDGCNCEVTDVLPSLMMSVCSSCDAENAHKQELARNRLVQGHCEKCHVRYSVCAQAIELNHISGGMKASSTRKSKSSSGSDDPMDEIAEELRYLRKKAKSDPRQALIKLGSPLPNQGACKHFKKSYKWFRFECCGRAFPCPTCHADSGCPAAALGVHASRMICGKCSMEQSYSPSQPCTKCNFAMVAKGSTHWDGGMGTRNTATMDAKDNKKYRGKFKTSSAKSDRVGVEAKKRRDYQKKFGEKM